MGCEGNEIRRSEVDTEGETSVEVVAPAPQGERTPHAKSLFMAADNTMVTIGGGYVGILNCDFCYDTDIVGFEDVHS